ncbi:YvcK family protein [soil metagenome]
MIKNNRLKRYLMPTMGLQKAAAMVLLGAFSFFLGFGLVYKDKVRTTLEGVAGLARQGAVHFVDQKDVEFALWLVGGLFLALGTYLTYRGFRSGINHIVETLNPGLTTGKTDVYLRRLQLAQGPRIVAMGGGTGLSTLLRGLKQQSSNITAIVTVTDDGGSSGRLIQEKSMIPPGDIRNCLVALADAEKQMTDLFQHRFKDDSGSLSGHAIGNLLIAALVDQAKGDFEKAVQMASAVLAIRGRVIPATLAHVGLRAELEDGTEVCGETAIVSAGRKIRKIHLDPQEVEAHKDAIQAILTADVICIGPGSVYTSVIPNLLVPGIRDALKQTKAPKIYICNVMTQPGESDSFTASEHVSTILTNAEAKVFDYAMVNTSPPSDQVRSKYEGVGQHFVEPDVDRIRAMGIKVIQGDFKSESDVVRHDPMKVAERVVSMLNR